MIDYWPTNGRLSYCESHVVSAIGLSYVLVAYGYILPRFHNMTLFYNCKQ